MRVSLGLDKKILVTEDRTPQDILEKPDLQEPSPTQGETLHDDVQRIRLPANISGRRGERGDRIKDTPEENKRPLSGLWRLPRVQKQNSWLKVETFTLRTYRCTPLTEGMKGVLC